MATFPTNPLACLPVGPCTAACRRLLVAFAQNRLDYSNSVLVGLLRSLSVTQNAVYSENSSSSSQTLWQHHWWACQSFIACGFPSAQHTKTPSWRQELFLTARRDILGDFHVADVKRLFILLTVSTSADSTTLPADSSSYGLRTSHLLTHLSTFSENILVSAFLLSLAPCTMNLTLFRFSDHYKSPAFLLLILASNRLMSLTVTTVELSAQRHETETKQFQNCFELFCFSFISVVRTVILAWYEPTVSDYVLRGVSAALRFVCAQLWPSCLVTKRRLAPVHFQTQIFPRFKFVFSTKLLLCCCRRCIVLAPSPLAHSFIKVDHVFRHRMIATVDCSSVSLPSCVYSRTTHRAFAFRCIYTICYSVYRDSWYRCYIPVSN